MAGLIRAVRNFVADESGATMVEYGIMVALIAVIAIAAVSLLGERIRDNFKKIADCLPSGCP